MLLSRTAATASSMPRSAELLIPTQLADALVAIPGVVEHGLFLGLAGTAIVAGPSGIRVIERPNA